MKYNVFKYNYNDYELIYAIKNGEEIPLEILLLKYDPFISHYVYKRTGHFDEDLIQEGRMVLYNSIYTYPESSDYSFFSYFELCFKRKINRILKREKLHRKYVLLAEFENELYETKIGSVKRKNIIPKMVFESELDEKLYNEVIIGGTKLKKYCLDNNLNYQTIIRKYRKLLKRIYDSIYSYILD